MLQSFTIPNCMPEAHFKKRLPVLSAQPNQFSMSASSSLYRDSKIHLFWQGVVYQRRCEHTATPWKQASVSDLSKSLEKYKNKISLRNIQNYFRLDVYLIYLSRCQGLDVQSPLQHAWRSVLSTACSERGCWLWFCISFLAALTDLCFWEFSI